MEFRQVLHAVEQGSSELPALPLTYIGGRDLNVVRMRRRGETFEAGHRPEEGGVK
jgi:hypothetical protein